VTTSITSKALIGIKAMDNNIFSDTYFFYCDDRSTFEGQLSELEKDSYFPIEIEDLSQFSYYPVDRAAYSLIALSESAEINVIESIVKLVFEKGKIKSPFIIIADAALKEKLSFYFEENEPNLLYVPISTNKIKEVIAARKNELFPFQCNLTIPKFKVSPYNIRVSKYSSEGNSIYEDQNITKIFDAIKSDKALNNQSFSALIRNLYHRKQQLINKVRINSCTYLLYILPIPSNKSINFSLMNY
jgi:hypothetical protein